MLSTIRNAKFSCLAIGLILLGSIPITHAFAEDKIPEPISSWYEALRQNDNEMMNALLDDNALIELKDIGITQTKSEFIESMDEWSEMNGDAVLLTRFNKATDQEIVIDVCYRFASNETQTVEAFEMIGEKIAKSIQEQVSEICSGF